jgi:hypothetical protein
MSETTMNASYKQLHKLGMHYRTLPTIDLAERIGSGQLSPSAHEVAKHELRRRQSANRRSRRRSEQELQLIKFYNDMKSDDIRLRLESGSLLPVAKAVAEAEMELRDTCKEVYLRAVGQRYDKMLSERPTPSAGATPSDAEETLRGIYQRMSIAELRRRLASGELLPDAQSLAEDELRRRLAGNSREAVILRQRAAREKRRRERPPIVMVPGWIIFNVFIALVCMAVSLKMPIDFIAMAWIWGSIYILRVVGKAVPKLAAPIGWIMVASPIYALGGMLWVAGKGQVSGGPFMGWILILLIVSLIPHGLGRQLVRGALHWGSWEELHQQLTKERQEHFKRVAEDRANRWL